MKSRLHPLFVSLIVIGSAGLAHAATFNWNGLATGGATGVSETWDTVTANWTGDGTTWPVSGSNNDAVFGGTAGVVTATPGAPSAVVNDITFNTTGYTLAGGPFFLVPAVSGTTGAVITTATSVSAEISASIAGGLGSSGTSGLTKAGAGTLTLSGINSFTGWFTSTGGTVKITKAAAINSIGTSNWIFANNSTFEMDGSEGNIALITRFQVNGGAILNTAGDNTINQGVFMNSTLSNTIRSNGGSLVIAGGIGGGTGSRKLTITGTSVSENRLAGIISNSSVVTTVEKADTGKWIFSGANTYTGATTVTAGNLTVFSATGLGKTATADVSVAAGAALNYASKGGTPLAIEGALTITGGAGTTLGGSIGTGPTSASINVTEAASISDDEHTVNIHGIPSVTPTTGTYTLISGGAGSSLNPTTAPTLGKIYNNTNFTVGALTPAASSITVGITAATPIADAYWSGGFNNEWAASDGTTGTSNWTASAAGPAQPLVPGSAANLIISATAPTLPPTSTVLGADMSINSLTIADTVNGLGLDADGSTLTVAAAGITMDSSVPTSIIGSKIVMGAGQTWTNNSVNGLTVSGNVSGAFALTKAGTGTLALSGDNTFTGNTRVAAGTLAVGHVNALVTSTLDMNTADSGTVSFIIPGTDTYNIGGLTGTRDIDAGGSILSIGAKNVTTEYSGELSNGSMNKVGTGFLTLSGNNTFSGNVTISAGRLILANSSALGVGPKTVSMRGVDRRLYLTNNITLPSNITLSVSTNSGDTGGINNESGDNTIQGQINFDSGNPALNISSSAGKLTISGNITLVTTSRPLHLGGGSTEDNMITGNVSDISTAAMNLIKQGVGKWILSGVNTYKGNTTVSGGTLVLASTGSLSFYPKTDGTSNNLNGTADLTLDGALGIDLTNANTAIEWPLIDEAGTLNETYGPNFSVTGFTETSAGIWKKGVGLDLYTFTEADGKLTLDAGVNTYANWLIDNPPATGFDTDSDNDGIPNGVENVLGTNPNAYSPGLTNISSTASSATYQHSLSGVIAGDVTHTYEWSTDLVEWKATTETNTGGTTATITPSAPASGVVTVTTAITDGPAAKLFTRIKASQP